MRESLELERQHLKSLIDSGVIIDDANTAYISADSCIECGVVLQPNVTIMGASRIAKGSIIGSNSVLDNAIIGEKVVIKASYIENSQVGDNTNVGPFAYIRNNSFIGNNCRIGDFIEVKSSTIGSGSKAAHLAYIGDAIVGRNVNVGCGSVFANYDGTKKSVTIVGDNVFIGANVNLVAPLAIGDDSYIAAGSTVTDSIGSDTLCIARTRQVNKNRRR